MEANNLLPLYLMPVAIVTVPEIVRASPAGQFHDRYWLVRCGMDCCLGMEDRAALARLEQALILPSSKHTPCCQRQLVVDRARGGCGRPR